MDTAKVFWSGRSQAVRLPKEYRFDVDKVRIRRHGSAIVLEPMLTDWAWLDDFPGQLDEDVIDAIQEAQAQQHRPAVDSFFR